LVEYAVDEKDENIFVRQYMLKLPAKEQLINLINQEKIKYQLI